MATFSIDEKTYRKDLVLPPGQGYGVRAGGIKPTSIIIHSTNGNKGSTFEAEANYLKNSHEVSAHYLVGKEGQIAQILPPDLMAWHAGQAKTEFQNLYSIGVENHHAVGDAWTVVQFQALTWLTRQLMAQFTISIPMIETHRYAALPPGRKSDPDDWSDKSFYAWRGALVPPTLTYRVNGIKVWQAQSLSGPLWGYLGMGETVIVDVTYSNGAGHLADGRGFVRLSELELVL
jgi:N-acetyl-anhydromuramyl-L-alanine amidase AmpD